MVKSGFFKPTKTKVIVFLLLLPIALLSLAIIFILGMSFGAPLSDVTPTIFAKVLLWAAGAVFCLFFWPVLVSYHYFQREMERLINIPSHYVFVLSAFWPYILASSLILTIINWYFL